MTTWRVVSGPVIEPVTLAEARLHLRVDTTDEDVLIAALIRTARELAEARTRRALVTQTIEALFPAFPCGPLELPRPPLQAVTWVRYYDTTDVEFTVSAATYSVDTASLLGRVVLRDGQSWPATTLRPLHGVIVRYTAGYGDGAGDVPERIRQWMLLTVGELYARREYATPGAALVPNPLVDGLLDEYRIVRA
jgi:uncharacterized phiE125 gp8 family phage protein